MAGGLVQRVLPGGAPRRHRREDRALGSCLASLMRAICLRIKLGGIVPAFGRGEMDDVFAPENLLRAPSGIWSHALRLLATSPVSSESAGNARHQGSRCRPAFAATFFPCQRQPFFPQSGRIRAEAEEGEHRVEAFGAARFRIQLREPIPPRRGPVVIAEGGGDDFLPAVFIVARPRDSDAFGQQGRPAEGFAVAEKLAEQIHEGVGVLCGECGQRPGKGRRRPPHASPCVRENWRGPPVPRCVSETPCWSSMSSARPAFRGAFRPRTRSRDAPGSRPKALRASGMRSSDSK